MNKSLFAVLVALLVLVAFTGLAVAEDKIIQGKLERVIVKKDKNGNPFSVLIMKNAKTLQGVNYTSDSPFFCFGDTHNQCKSLKAGQTTKIVYSDRPRGAIVLAVSP